VLVLVAIALWVVVGIVVTVAAVHDLGRAADAATEAQRTGRREDVAPADVLAPLRRAAAAAARAESRLDGPGTWALRPVPVLGRHVRALAAMARSAAEASDAGADVLVTAQDLIDERPAAGAPRVAALTRLGSALDRVHTRLAAAPVPAGDHLVGPVSTRRDKLAADLADADEGARSASAAVGAVRTLVGGPSRYLLLMANNAEMRAGSGMFLSAATLTGAEGRLTLGDAQRTADLTLDQPVALPDELRSLWGFTNPGAEWRNLGMTPRFDVNAEVAARMWQARTGEAVDGVLAVDPVALAAIVDATGPVDVDGRPLDGDALVDHLLHGQYEALRGRPAAVDAAQADRREELGTIAAAAVDAVDAGGVDVRALANGLRRAARGRHVLAWASAPATQRGWEAGGVAGTVGPRSLGVSLINRGGNKLDRFVHPELRISAAPAEHGARRVEVEVALANRVGAGEVPYVLGPSKGIEGAPGDYLGFLAVTLPAGARDVELADLPLVAAGPDGPTSVVAGQLRIPRGTSVTVTVRFTVDGGAPLQVEPSARVGASTWRTPQGKPFTDARRHRLDWADLTK
jgi:hypothetical protein